MCAFLSVTCFLVAFWNTLPWCADEFRRFFVILGATVAVDVAVVQPLHVAAVGTWIWLTDDSDEEVESDASPPSRHQASETRSDGLDESAGDKRPGTAAKTEKQRVAGTEQIRAIFDCCAIGGQRVFVGPPDAVLLSKRVVPWALGAPRTRHHPAAPAPFPLKCGDLQDLAGRPVPSAAASVPAFGATNDDDKASASSLTQLEGTGGMSGTHDTAFSLTQLEGTGGSEQQRMRRARDDDDDDADYADPVIDAMDL